MTNIDDYWDSFDWEIVFDLGDGDLFVFKTQRRITSMERYTIEEVLHRVFETLGVKAAALVLDSGDTFEVRRRKPDTEAA